ncbi:MAG: hypothetical protein J1E40_12435 [Oscillospiraceae bacterium]|nr:hypothetical protein [Oscillospiraceae bacterium]
MKKILPILFIIVSLTLSGCSIKKEYDLHGKEQVEALREEAKGWQSGRYLFTDLGTGEMNQAFSFMYNSDGSQTYLYEHITEGSYYIEYYGGGMIYILDGENISVLDEGSADYVSYNKDNPHPYSAGDLLFYENLFVRSSVENSDDQGNVTYLYNYDTDKINRSLGTSLKSFVTTYAFDQEGNFMYFTQSNSDGENDFSYRIELVDINSITKIENPMMSE